MFKCIWKVTVFGLVLLGAMHGFTQSGSEKMVRHLRLALPITPSTISSAAMLWSGATGIQTGVECQFSGGPRQEGRILSFLDLSGMSIPESVDEMMKQIPQYQATWMGEFLLLRPRDGNGVLDRVVPRFSLRQASLVSAVQAVRQIYEPDYVIRALPQSAPADEGDYARQKREQYNARFKPMITLDISNAPVVDILTDIARQVGASWTVQYRTEARRFEDALVTMVAPSGLQVTAGPRMMRAVK